VLLKANKGVFIMKYKQIIEKMKLEEKVGLLSGKDIWSTKSVKRLGVPSLLLSDGPHGLRKQRAKGDHLGLNESIPATCFPTAATVANSWDPDLGEAIGKALGEEAVALQVNVLLGPGLNIKRSPLCGRNFEYFSEDPYMSGKMAAGYIRGIQSQGVAACPKHFAANNQELRRMANDSIVDERTLREIYLAGFEIAVKEGKPKAIMTSYNQLNGTYTNEDYHLLQDILREEWGFNGAVITDWGGGNDYVAGVKAGSNLEMPGTGGDSEEQLIQAVKEGSISLDIIDQRVDELLELIFTTTEKKEEVAEGNLQIPIEMVERHHALARKAAEESIVLLKNDDSILPLNNIVKVAIVGDFALKPRYQGAGSSVVNSLRLDNLLEASEKSDIQIAGFAQGYKRNAGEDQVLQEEAIKLAQNSDVVVYCIGLEEAMESEGIDRSHMELHPKQIALLSSLAKVNTNIIVVLSGGSAIVMPWIDQCKAIVHGYLGGQAGAEAMLRVITGEVNPSGKLAETYPVRYQDTPTYYYWHNKERISEYRESLFVGYRYYDTVNSKVRFPFGFGLSYTQFSYSDLKVSDKEVTFYLTNTGDRDGAEIIQLYIGKEDGLVFGPKKELKGFIKVYLKSGESTTVTLSLEDRAFRYFDRNTNRWEKEGGIYHIMVGSSVTDIRLTQEISVYGTVSHSPYEKEKLPSYYRGNIEQVSDQEFEELLGHSMPEGSWHTKELLTMNDTLSQMYYAKSLLARLIYHLLTWMKERSMKKGKPDLNILFIYNMTFRGIAKMMNGAVTMEMAKNILVIVNGHFIKGLGGLVKAYFKYKRVKGSWRESS
jgi:beta-glucosidase